MKKFLLTLIVTMLACIGAWAQETPLIDAGPDGATGLSAFQMSSQEVKNLNLKVGDVLKLYWKATTDVYASVSFLPTGEYTEIFGVNTNNDGIYTDWTVKEFELTENQITSLEKGFSATWEHNITLQKLTLVHYAPATGVTLNKTSISIGIGATDNSLKAHVEATEGEARQTVEWSVVSGNEYVDINSTTGEITGKAAGTAVVHATVPGADIPCDECTVTVKQGYTLTATADPTSVTNAIARTITITPVVKLGEEVRSEGFNLSYSLIDNTDEKVTNVGNVVTVEADATPCTKTVLVTVTDPNDVYAGATTTVNFTIVAAPYITMTSVNETSFTVAKGMADHERPQIQVESQVSNGDGTYMNPQPEINYSAKVVDGYDLIVTLTQNPGNAKWFRIDPVAAGTTKVKVTASAVVDGVTISDSKIVDVTVTGMKIQVTAADNLTVNDDQTLTLDAIKAAITKVYSTQTDLPSTDYVVEIYKDDVLLTEDIAAPHSSNFTLTIKVKSNNAEYVDADPKVINVTVTHLQSFDLALPVTPSSSIMDNGQKAVITPTATQTGTDTPVTLSDFDMTYTLSAPDVATVVKDDENHTITVTGKNAGTVTVTVTAHPAQINGEDVYANVTNTTTITVTESQKVYLTTEIGEDGKTYVVVNVPEGGAFGGISDTPKIDVANSTVDLEALKNAANVKVKGQVANSDIQELVCLIGGVTGAVGNCKILDMGEATMTEKITSIGSKCSLVGGYYDVDNQCSKSMLNAEKIVLPKPATGVDGGTILPANTNGLFSNWNNNASNELTELVIPEGWTELASGCFGKTEAAASGQGLDHITSLTLPASIETISSYVFASCTSLKSVDMSACDKLTVIPESAFADCRKGPGDGLRDIKFPPNLVYIYDNAFIHHEANVLMFPPKLREIHEGAFENYGGANSLTDVFFTGVAVTPNFVATTAFSASTQMCNNSVADNAKLPDGSNAISNGTITRNSYHNGGFLGCILHFPAEADKWKYTDPYRVYNDGGRSKYTGGNESEWNDKSKFGYNPDGWTKGFLDEVSSKTADMHEQQAGITYGTETTRWDKQLTDGVFIDGGYPDRTFGSNKLWPSQQQMQNGYTISRAGYLWNGTQMTTRELDLDNNVDLRGLYQFIVAFTDAPDSPERWKFSKYDNDKWYTFCVPFNMSVEEIKNVFGESTQVCRFSNVTRTVSEDATPNKIVLEFRKSVMVAGGYSSSDKIKVSTVMGSDGNAVDTYADATTTGIVHHVPYMIKPSGNITIEDPANPNFIKPEFKEDGYRVLPNFKRVGGVMVFDVIKNSGYSYSFEGIFEPIPIPNHVYFLSKDKNDGKHKFFFSNNAKGKLNAYTASVRVRKENSAEDRGDDDWTAFFNSKTVPGSESAPIFMSLFADDEDATEIEQVEIVCGEEKVIDEKVYTVNGVLMNGNNLPAGLYIKNGKKFIVK